MSMDCWAILELDEQADERSVKRQYARLLKIHRPDEDAEGFQRLRDAYEQALPMARFRQTVAAESANDNPVQALLAEAFQRPGDLDQSLAQEPWSVAVEPAAEYERQALPLDSEPVRRVEPALYEAQPPVPLDGERIRRVEPASDEELSPAPLDDKHIRRVEPAPYEERPAVPLEIERVRRVEPAPYEEPRAARPDSAPIRLVESAPDDGRIVQALLRELNNDNFRQRWDLALAQQCDEAFERGLLQHCLGNPGACLPIIEWAVERLQWLTPWQRVAMNNLQANGLASVLLDGYRTGLEPLLISHQEDALLAQLQALAAQPWLQIYDQRLQLYRLVLFLLRASPEWSQPLFEQICQLFAWQEAMPPAPEAVWLELLQRGEQERYFQRLKTWALDKQTLQIKAVPEGRAAYLFLNNLGVYRQSRVVADFSADDWRACQRLSEVFQQQYPRLRERLPDNDLFFWIKLMPRAIAPSSIRQIVTMGLLWLIGLEFTLWNAKDPDIIVVVLIGSFVGGFVAWRFLNTLALVWLTLRQPLLGLDLWLTYHLTPIELNPGHRWRPLGNGLPWLITGGFFSALMGPFGALIYLSISLIKLVQAQSPRPEPAAKKGWRRHWPALLKFTACTPLQLTAFSLLAVLYLMHCIEQPKAAHPPPVAVRASSAAFH